MYLSPKIITINRDTAKDLAFHGGLSIFVGMFIGVMLVKGGWFYASGLVLMAPIAIALISRPFLGILLWLLVMPFVDILPNAAMMYWLFHRILIVLVLALTIILNRWRETRVHAQLRPPDVAVLILAGMTPLLIVASHTDLYLPLIRSADRILVPLLIYISIRLNPLDEQNRKLLLWTVLFVAVTQGFIGLMSIIAPGILPTALRAYRQGYASGTLVNPNVYATTLIFCALLLFHSVMGRKPSWIRCLYLLACALCVSGVFFSMERAVWLALSLVLLGLLWIYPKVMIRILLVGAIIVGGLLAAGFLSKYLGFASNRFSHEQPVYDRIVVSDAMIQMAREKPVFGWGYDTLNTNIAQYYRTIGAARIASGLVTSHNTYLTIFAEQGSIILLLTLFPVVWLLVKSFRNRRLISTRGSETKSMVIELWLSALSYLLISNFLDMRFFPYSIGLWWLTLGLIANVVAPMRVALRVSSESRRNVPNKAEPDFTRSRHPDYQRS